MTYNAGMAGVASVAAKEASTCRPRSTDAMDRGAS
jgi:hypothetical protein